MKSITPRFWGPVLFGILLGCEGGADPSPGTLVRSFAVGSGFSCAVPEDGRLYCWGRNDAGQLARRDGLNASQPAPVLSGPLRLSALAGGTSQVCGLLSDRRATCWGAGSGALRASGGDRSYDRVSVGDFACGLTATGEAWCWDSPGADARQIEGGPWVRLSAGGNGACALDVAGAAWCWEGASVVPQAVSGGLAFDAVTRGGRHACGLTSAGQAWCWGENDFGQLGDRTRIDRVDPVPVQGEVPGTELLFQDVVAGGEFTCAVDATGAGFCWGRADSGQLGFGGPPPAPDLAFSRPVRVVTPTPLVQFTPGGAHVCALDMEARLYCWGGNGSGELGTGSGAPLATEPVAVDWGVNP